MERYCLYGMSLVSDLAFPQLVKETEEYRRQDPGGWEDWGMDCSIRMTGRLRL